MSSLYEQLGGDAAIDQLVDIFYRKVIRDNLLYPFFDEVDMARQIQKQKAFLTMVLGGPNGYTGRDLRSAHAPLLRHGITDQHFDAVMTHLVDSLRELGVDPAAIAAVAELAESTRRDVLCR